MVVCRAMRISVILTDLDGTLLSQEGQLVPSARQVLRVLRAMKVPVVPLTSKTEPELRGWLGEIDGGGVGAFENGAGLVTPLGVEVFPGAVPVSELREVLDEIRHRLSLPVSALDELPDATLTAITGLEAGALARARDRSFDLPLLASVEAAKGLREALNGYPRVRLTAGGSFWHLHGCHDKADAARRVLALVPPGGRSVGLGDAANDAGFLAIVDVPVLLPSPVGLDPRLREAFPGARVAPCPGGEGWSQAVEALLASEPAVPRAQPEVA
jgi:mannosyl-3-phosphoglycerate phosphatase